MPAGVVAEMEVGAPAGALVAVVAEETAAQVRAAAVARPMCPLTPHI